MLDTQDARAELWSRYEHGRIDADELESRLRMLDQAGTETSVSAAIDGPVARRRRRRRGAIRLLSVPLVILFIVVPLVVVLLVFVAVVGNRTVHTNGPGGAVATTVVGAGPVPPPASADVAATAPACETVEAKPTGPELTFGPHILSDPPAAIEGYELTDDFQVGSEADAVWSIAQGDPPPQHAWGRAYTATDGSGYTIEMRGYIYESADVLSQVIASGNTAAACQYAARPFAIDSIPFAGGSTVDAAGPASFASFTAGAYRVMVEAKDPEQARAEADAVAALTAEWNALQALQPAA